MIQIAATKLTIAENDGTPATLDIGLLEQNLGNAFRNLGYNDSWMAEDISLSITEKIKDSSATLVTRGQIDTMVNTILNALGYPDVAAEYAKIIGISPFDAARKVMRPWTLQEISELLSRALPITQNQLEKVTELCENAVSKLDLHIISDKLILELATHIIANDNSSAQADPHDVQSDIYAYWELHGVSDQAKELVTSGILHPLPPSQFLPRARLAVSFSKLAALYPDWWMPMSLNATIQKMAPFITEIITAMHRELAALHPLMADSLPHVIVQECRAIMEKEPNLWKKKNREELLAFLENTLYDSIAPKLPFAFNLSIK